MATVKLRRRSGGMVDRGRAYRILVDGEQVDKIKHGETKTLEVDAGEHVVRLKVDWMSCQPVEVSVPDAGEVELYCEPLGKPVLYLFQALFQPGRYIALRLADGGGQR